MNAAPPMISREPIAHGGGVTEAARIHGGAPGDWLDLSTGINPHPVSLPPIPGEAWHRLPDRHLVDAARQAAKTHYAAQACLPLPVPGTQSVIQHLPGVCDPARPVAVLSPTYGEYARVLAEAGLHVDLIPDLDAVRPEHGLVVAVNPNNPTGRLIPRAALLDLAERLHGRGGRLHVDEAFMDFSPGESLAAHAGRVPGLTVFRSFGKFFGLAGLRLGFVLAEEGDLARFANRLGPWPVSGPALVVAARLMAEDHSATRQAIAARHAALLAVLERAGLNVIGGAGLFVLVDHPKAGLLHAHLCRHHILVRQFDYERRWLRFGLAPDAAALERLARALSDF